MIISKTPYRVSFFGGGSDYPEWYSKYGGEVISTTINKYIYVSLRELPKFFSHKYRILYSKDEMVQSIDQIKLRPVREVIKYYKILNGLEIHYDGDLPSRSGVASSSSFVVGLINCLMVYKKREISKKQLAKESIFVEQKVIKEVVGIQDQIACSYGGFNNIKFFRNGSFKVHEMINYKKSVNQLEKNLYLVYSRFQRTAEKIAKSFVNKLSEKKINEMDRMNEILLEAKKGLSKGDIGDFGSLLHESWILKKKLSNKISNLKLDNLYDYALESGATGGKLLGAGGGGFFIFYVPESNRKLFLNKMKKNIVMPIKFETKGSEIILK